MRTPVLLAAAAVLAAACATPRWNQRNYMAYHDAQTPPVYALLGDRARLGLTPAQVTTIDSIAQALEDENRPLLAQLREITGSRPGGPVRPPANRDQEERFLPVLEQVGANNRRAMDGVGRALTPEQRMKVCQLQHERHGDREDVLTGRRPRPGRPRMRPPAEVRGDSAAVERLRRGWWSWCPDGPAQAGR